MSTATLVRASLLTCALAALATGIGALILASLLNIDPAFQPVSLAPVVAITIAYGIGATVVYGIIARRASDPRRTWIRVAIVAFVLLLVPDLFLLIGPSDTPMGPVSTTGMLALVILHFIAAPVIVLGLLRFAPPGQAPPL